MKISMKWFLLLLLCGLIYAPVFGQTEAADADTTIYNVVEEMPRLPFVACEYLDTTIQVINACAQKELLKVVNQNIVYPDSARIKGIEGMVVAQFIVEKDGSISQPTIVKDIGGQCGAEVLRILYGLQASGERWIPAKLNDQVVRFKYTLPVRFKITEPLPYVLVDGDSLWVDVDVPLNYKGGFEQLVIDINDKLQYPDSGLDSCLIGALDIKLKIDRDSDVDIIEITDLPKLGFDFWYEATNAVLSTTGKWEPAQYQGEKVPTSYDLNLAFVPEAAACEEPVERYRKAIDLMNEGQLLFADTTSRDTAITLMSDAIALFPNYPEFLFQRGQAYISTNQFNEACYDITLGKEISGVSWFDNILPLICAGVEIKEEDEEEKE